MAFFREDTDSLLLAIALIEQARAGWVEAVPRQSPFGAISPLTRGRSCRASQTSKASRVRNSRGSSTTSSQTHRAGA